MNDVIRPPEGWTLYHSVAFLLIAASCIDGEADGAERAAIQRRLAQYPDLPEASLVGVLREAAAYYGRLREAGAVGHALDQHGRRLGKALGDPRARQLVLDDVRAVFGADEVLAPQEEALLKGLHVHFDVALPAALGG